MFLCVFFRSRIVDDDIDLKTLPCNSEDVSAYDNVEENTPTIADIVDERPKLIQQLEEYKTEKWKGVTVQSGIIKFLLKHFAISKV